MAFLRLALDNILRRPLRSVLTVCGVALGVGAFVALIGFASAFEREWLQVYRSKGTDICVIRGTWLRAQVDESLCEELRALSVVSEAAPIAIDLVEFTPEVSAVVQGWLEDSFEFESFTILQGRRIQGDEPEIMLGEVLADSLGKTTGDEVQVVGAPFRVVAIYRGRQSFETAGAVVPLHQLQRVSDLGSKVAGFNVRLRRPAVGESPADHIRRAQSLIESRLPRLRAMPVGDMVSKSVVTGVVRSTAWGTSLIALIIGTLGVANTMAMSVVERTREIGIMRALGWRRSRVVRLILLEASLLGIAGGVMGGVAGRLGLGALASNRMAPGMVEGHVSAVQFAEAMLVAVGISLIAAALPAYRATVVAPVEALRHD
ncbi:MAG: ABC transporter permease [Acidobacteria bacterium]|nr:ABC transporter permease [Acidobacteriota bacterium]